MKPETNQDETPRHESRLVRRSESDIRALTLGMTLSLIVGALVFVVKTAAYILTGSAAILSDAIESVVHIAAVSFAFYSLRLSHKPVDAGHLYGHAKVGFFSAGFEGAMIVLAALFISAEAIRKWYSRVGAGKRGFGGRPDHWRYGDQRRVGRLSAPGR